MRNPIGIYEKALPAGPLVEAIAEAATLGFDTFEVSVDETDERLARLDWSDEECRRVRTAAEEAGIQLFSICFSGHRRFPMGSEDAATEARANEMMEKALRLCRLLGVRVLQMAGYDVFYEPSGPATQARFAKNMARGAALAAGQGIMLAVETVEKHITSVDAALELVEPINNPWMTIYPDTANLYMQGLDPVAQIAKARGRLTALHLRDAPDDAYLPFGEGKVDFDGLFATLREMDFAGPLVVELWNSEFKAGKSYKAGYRDVLAQAREFILEKMRQGEKGA